MAALAGAATAEKLGQKGGVLWARREGRPAPQEAALRSALEWPDHEVAVGTLDGVVIGYGVVIPRSCIAGLNELTLGFAATLVGACLTYWAGLRLVARDGERRDGEA